MASPRTIRSAIFLPKLTGTGRPAIAFERCFLDWTVGVCQITQGEIISIDGKQLRGSYDKHNKKAAIHMVSAWANQNRMVLGQVKVDDKSNEITAIPQLIKVLVLKGCIFTARAAPH